MPDSVALPSSRRSVWLKRAPFVLIMLGAAAGAFFFRNALSLQSLAENYAVLLAYRDAHFVLAALAFAGIYTVIVVLGLPGALVASITGGVIFGVLVGLALNLSAAILGASGLFLAARAGFGADVAAKIDAKGGMGAKLQAAIRRNEWSALLTMRLVPVVPFFLANLLPAFMGVRFVVFFVTTALGVIPGALVYTWVGAGLSDVLARGETPDLSILSSPNVWGPLLGLGLLSAFPMLLRALRKGDL